MLKVTKEKSADAVLIKMSGTIEESTDLNSVLGPLATQMIVDTLDLRALNSIGIKSWITYFSKAEGTDTKVTFINCSPAVVECVNMISNFLCGGVVESVLVPFACPSCLEECNHVFTVDQLRAAKLKPEAPSCPKCSTRMLFDDIPEEYFGFLMRSPARI